MKPSTHFARRAAWTGLLALMLVLAVVAVAHASDEYKRTAISAYYSVVRDEPYAAYTTADEFKRTSLVAYYSVVRDEPYAAYTTADEFKRTSLVPYYRALH